MIVSIIRNLTKNKVATIIGVSLDLIVIISLLFFLIYNKRWSEAIISFIITDIVF